MIRFFFDFFYRKDDSFNNILVSFIITFSIFTFICGLCVVWKRECRKYKNKKREIQYILEYTKEGKIKNGFTFDAIDDLRVNIDKLKKKREEKEKREKERAKEEEKYRNIIFYFVVLYYIYKIYQVI